MSQQPSRQWMTVKVMTRNEEAQDIVSFELSDPDGRTLPPFSAGAHIDVEVNRDIVRQYSLCNHPDEQHRYQIAVLKVADSRGGSIAMHEHIQVGSLVKISEPKNHFPLMPGAKKSILFAGGIGVTPLMCMAERLAHMGADFEFHYSARSVERMAFVNRIKASGFVDKVRFHIDDGPADQKLGVKAALGKKGLFGGVPRDVHAYVCGPTGFMDFVLQSAKDNKWPDEQLHREYFSPAASLEIAKSSAFEVQIASTGKTYEIPADLSIVKALRLHGIEIPTSCEEGICGTCLTSVLEGVPDHRDFILSPKEKVRNNQMTPCCSRSKSPKLVLDL
jgi:vanillate O-demethylase ferredoxin subunit